MRRARGDQPVDDAHPRRLRRAAQLRRVLGGCDPEAIIAALEPLTTERRQQRLEEVIGQRLGSVALVMDAPHDPHNGAAMMRSCDAFGVLRLHVVERTETFQASGAVAKGTQRWVDVESYPSVSSALQALEGFELVGTHPEGELLPADLSSIPRLAIVMGNEHDGISEALSAACQRMVRVPMRGFVESLNVSVTAAILLHAATHGRAGDLSPAERRELYARGLAMSVPRALAVLEARGVVPGQKDGW